MKLTIDCDLTPSKKEVLKLFQQTLNEMYSLNFDALIDAARNLQEELTVEVANLDKFENPALLLEVLENLNTENHFFAFVLK